MDVPAIGSAIGAVVTFLGSAGAAAFAVKTALIMAASFAISKLTAPSFASVLPRDIIAQSGSQHKIIVYGETVVSGTMMYMNQKPISGDENYELWIALVHCAHEVNAMDDFFYESDELTSGGALSWSANKSTVNSGRWHADDATHEAATIYRVLGTGGQDLPTDYTSAFSDLTVAHDANGYACSFHKFQIFDESESLFSGGQPGNIRARIQGRIIYDPRLDITPGASPNNASFFAYTDNPVLIAVDFLRNYWVPVLADDRFDWTHVGEQADKCDVTVGVPPAQSPENTQKRYTCNGAISLGVENDTNLAAILATCLGRRITVNGKVRIIVGDDQTADVTLDETHIIGAIKVRFATPKKERYNKIIGTYISEDESYVRTDFLPVEDATFVTRDNSEVITKEIPLELVHNEYQAQRIAYKHLQQSDQQVIVEVPLRWSGMRLTPGTYVSLSYDKFNWSSKLFRCESVRILAKGVPVTAILREDSASAWDDPLVADYTTRTAAGLITKPAEPVPIPTSMTAVATLEGIYVSWVNPTQRAAWDYVDVYASATSAWSGVTLVASRVTTGDFLHLLAPGTTRFYWVRAVRLGIESNREPNSDTSDRTDTSPPAIAPGATAGADLGTDVRNEVGEILFDIDLRNDQLVTGALSSMNENPSMRHQRRNEDGDLAPASWFSSNDADRVVYEDPDVRDVMKITGSNAIASNTAFRINQDTTYEFVILIKDLAGSSSVVDLSVFQLHGELTSGKLAIGTNISPEPEVQNRNTSFNIVENMALTTSYQVFAGTYTPTVGAVWASLAIATSSRDVLVEWAIVRTQSTVGADWDTNLDNIPTGVVEIIFQSTPPSGVLGDLWIDSDDNKLYRHNGSNFVEVQDDNIGDAIADAAGAQGTADGKIYTFLQITAPVNGDHPEGALEVGDLWVDSDDDNKLYRWDSGWTLVRDDGIAAALSDASNAQATADGKIVTFWATSAPTAEGVGDFWVETDADNRMYRWSGSAWIDIRDGTIANAQSDAAQGIADASDAQSTADGKVVTFVQTSAPTAEGVGDLWMDTDDDNKLYRWSGSAWIEYAQEAADWGLVFGTGRPEDDADVTGHHNSALNRGYLTDNLAFWWNQVEATTNISSATGWSVVDGQSGPLGGTALRFNTATARNIFSEQFPVDVNKNYRVSFLAVQVSGTKAHYLGVSFFDNVGANIAGPGGGGWPGGGTYWYTVVNAAFTTSWVDYSFTFGPDSVGNIPSNAVTMGLIGLLNFSGSGTVDVRFQGLRIQEIASTDDLAQDAVGVTDQTDSSNTTLTSGTYANVSTSAEVTIEGGKALIIVTAEAGGSVTNDDNGCQLELQTSIDGGSYVTRTDFRAGVRTDGGGDANWFIPVNCVYVQEGIGSTVQARLRGKQINMGDGLKNVTITNPSITIVGVKR